MALFLIAIAHLLIGTSSNIATMFLSFSGPSLFIALLGIAVQFLEFYIIFTLAKRHANPKFLLAFYIYWGTLAGAALANAFIHSNLSYAINIANYIYMIVLVIFLMMAPVNSKRLKIYCAFHIVTTLYFINLFVKAMLPDTGNQAPNAEEAMATIALTLLLSFITDCLLVVVAWWSCRLHQTGTKESTA